MSCAARSMSTPFYPVATASRVSGSSGATGTVDPATTFDVYDATFGDADDDDEGSDPTPSADDAIWPGGSNAAPTTPLTPDVPQDNGSTNTVYPPGVTASGFAASSPTIGTVPLTAYAATNSVANAAPTTSHATLWAVGGFALAAGVLAIALTKKGSRRRGRR